MFITPVNTFSTYCLANLTSQTNIQCMNNNSKVMTNLKSRMLTTFKKLHIYHSNIITNQLQIKKNI